MTSDDLLTRGISPASNGSVGDDERKEHPAAAASATSAKSKKKEDKGIEHVLRALNSLQTTEEKLAALCKKYTELLEEHRVMQTAAKQHSRKLSVVCREKEQLQSEHSKAVLAKSKLESLCRELQRHNKLVKEESLARAREEEEKRKEVTTKFQTTINDIQGQMKEHYQKNTKLREENIELANKLKNLIEQYELREQHIEKMFKHKDLEQQLIDAKLAQASLQITEAKESSLQEKQMLLTEATDAHKRVRVLEEQEVALRAQVAMYTEKYEEFQGTLSKSNEVFGSFKSEMEKMTKKIKKLEKETGMWKSRWEKSTKGLLEMAEEKTKNEKEISRLNNKVQKLESLCRALQVERNKAPGEEKAQNESAEVISDVSPDSSEVTTEVKVDSTEVTSTTETPPNTPEQSSRASPETVLPPTQESGETVLPPTQESGETVLPPTQESGETVLPPSQESAETVMPPTQESGETVLPPTQESGETVLPPAEEEARQDGVCHKEESTE